MRGIQTTKLKRQRGSCMSRSSEATNTHVVDDIPLACMEHQGRGEGAGPQRYWQLYFRETLLTLLCSPLGSEARVLDADALRWVQFERSRPIHLSRTPVTPLRVGQRLTGSLARASTKYEQDHVRIKKGGRAMSSKLWQLVPIWNLSPTLTLRSCAAGTDVAGDGIVSNLITIVRRS